MRSGVGAIADIHRHKVSSLGLVIRGTVKSDHTGGDINAERRGIGAGQGVSQGVAGIGIGGRHRIHGDLVLSRTKSRR